MKVSFTLLSIMLLSLSLLTSCFNSRELNQLAIVVGIGIDNVPKSNQYRVTVQVINPNMLGTKPQGGGGQSMSPNIIFSSEDHTLFGALRKTSQKMSRRLFFGHSQLLIIGESLARKGINDIFDFYERSHELRLTSSVVIARGSDAESLLRVLTPLESASSNSIKGRVKVSSESWAQSSDKVIADVITSLQGPGDPIISGMHIIGNPSLGQKKANLEQAHPLAIIETKGLAIFSNGRLIKWLDGKTARGAVWALDNMKSTSINIDCVDKKEGMSIEVERSSTKVRAHMEKGKPILFLHVKEEGNLSEVDCALNPNNRKTILKLQQQWATETKREILSAIKATQRTKSDVFGFSTEMERTHPKAWVKIQEQWPDVYSASHVEVHVETYIRRTGLRIKSYMDSEEKYAARLKSVNKESE